MKQAAVLPIALFAFQIGTELVASPSDFRFRRPVINVSAGRNYLVVDETIRRHSRRDLADVRLFTHAGRTVPYALRIMRGDTSRDRMRARIVNLGLAAGRTDFQIEVPPELDYDAIELAISRRDFIAEVAVEGLSDRAPAAAVNLQRHVIYERSDDGLGSSTTIRLPASSFERLHLSISEPVEPGDVTGVSLHASRRTPAIWSTLPHRAERTDAAGQTRFRWSEEAPVERLVVQVAEQQNDFSRAIRLLDRDGRTVATGEIHRVSSRVSPVVRSETLALDVPSRASQLIIENGDDQPLEIENVRLLAAERRIYFDAAGDEVTLFYGSEAATPPRYDYAKLFRDAPAARAHLGAETLNELYSDPRPFTERHPAVLWSSLVAAIAALAILALRELRQPHR